MAQGWRSFLHARMREWHDGDTCEVEIDSGFGAYHRVAIRVYGLSAPEVSGVEAPLGVMAREVARDIAKPDSQCQLWTWRQSFTRYVGRIVLAGGADVALMLIERGFARAWDGKTKRPRHDGVVQAGERHEEGPTFEAYPIADPLAEVAEYRRILQRDFRP